MRYTSTYTNHPLMRPGAFMNKHPKKEHTANDDVYIEKVWSKLDTVMALNVLVILFRSSLANCAEGPPEGRAGL